MTLLVGEEEDQYVVHEDLLCSRSPFFAAAVKKAWNEGQERRVPLPDDNNDVIKLYAQWLYGGRIFSRPMGGEVGEHCE